MFFDLKNVFLRKNKVLKTSYVMNGVEEGVVAGTGVRERERE